MAKSVKGKHHVWGDKWRYWKQLDAAVDDCWKWSRFYCLGGQIKEKYGTLRFYVYFHHQIHDLIYVGHVYSRFPEWLWRLDINIYCSKYFNWSRNIICWLQRKAYRRVYSKLVRKYPKIRNEILCSADYPELLEGL